MTRPTKFPANRFYVWQMNDYSWHISASHDWRGNNAEASTALWAAGLDRGFETKEAARNALDAWLGR